LDLTKLYWFLSRRKRIALDTCVFIYHFGDHPDYASLTIPIFEWIQARRHGALSSVLTITELMVMPHKEGDPIRLNKYRSLLLTLPNFEWTPIDPFTADVAAKLRAEYKLRTPDAFQAAAAIVANTPGFITNDPIFRRVKELDVLILDDLLP
jgi:predicted nucleic acid-binding protein